MTWPVLVAARLPAAVSLWTLHVTDRMATRPEHFIGGPWWQYGPAVLVQALPWTPLALVGRVALAAPGDGAGAGGGATACSGPGRWSRSWSCRRRRSRTPITRSTPCPRCRSGRRWGWPGSGPGSAVGGGRRRGSAAGPWPCSSGSGLGCGPGPPRRSAPGSTAGGPSGPCASGSAGRSTGRRPWPSSTRTGTASPTPRRSARCRTTGPSGSSTSAAPPRWRQGVDDLAARPPGPGAYALLGRDRDLPALRRLGRVETLSGGRPTGSTGPSPSSGSRRGPPADRPPIDPSDDPSTDRLRPPPAPQDPAQDPKFRHTRRH